MTAADSLLGALAALALGVLAATGVCVLLSLATPIGAVRAVDPALGFHADWTVIGSCVVLLVGILGGVAVTLAFVGSRRAGRPVAPSVPDTSRIVSGAVRSGLPAPAIVGIRFALDRGRGPDAIPIGSSLVGAALAVAVVATTLTFAGGLDRLVSHPGL
ncbi:MAG: hypothetical protein ACRDJU_14710 [Actinomycetota bacterium]